MDKFRFIVCFMSYFLLSTAQKIKQLRVPDIVDIRSHDSAILDCDYELTSTHGLYVKWFFGDNPNPVYQWIPNHDPQALGILKDKLDLSYKATNDKYSMYRAMSIKRLSLDLTGDYKCVVSSFDGEDAMTKRMIVLEPPKNVEVFQVKEDEDSVTVVCMAQGMFPKPILNITFEGNPLVEDTSMQTTKTDDGLYNATTLVTIKEETLESPTDFICKIHIPDTQYSKEVPFKYYSENTAFRMVSSTWLLILSTIILCASLS